LILRTEGFINLLESNFEQADKCFSEAVENHRKAKYFDAVADATFGRALVAFQQGDSDQALGFLKSILDSVEQIRLNADFVAVGELFEEIYDESNNYLDALDTWRRIRVAMRNSDPTSENLRRCDARIVILEAKLAEQPARKAEILTELRVELGDDFFGHFDAVSELGRAFIGCQKAEMAMRLADEALALPAYREGFPEFDCEWLDIKARAQELLGDYLGAKTSADRAFELYFDREAYFLAKEMRDLSLRVAKLAA
jgi:tetratricopeptide (TPR) repeat protein